MEGDESKPPFLPDDTQLHELSDRIAKNVEEFQQFVDDFNVAIYQDETFRDMTAESYNRKKAYMKSNVRELSQLHNSLADKYSNLIEDVCKHLQSSDSSSSPQVNQSLAPNFSKATGFELLWNPSGVGFYLSKVAGTSRSGSEASMSSVSKPEVPPVNVDALKVKETKDPVHDGSDSGSESFMSTVKKLPVSLVNDDALKVEATKDSGSEASVSFVNEPSIPPAIDNALKVEESNKDLLEKISNLEEKVGSLKQKIQSVTDENDEINEEIKIGITDVSTYMSGSTPKLKAMKEELDTSKGFAKTINEHMCRILDEKIGNQVEHDSEMKEMDMKMNEYVNEIARLKSKHEKEEKIWNGITEQLKNELKDKIESLADLGKKMEALIVDKSDQNNLIFKLETELTSVKFENVGLVPSFENVQKITDEMKVKLVELGKVVDKQIEAMSDADKR